MNTSDGAQQSVPGGDAAALILEGVSKTIAQNVILNNLTISLPCTETVLLLGANGAGKSTLLRICSGLMRPSAGSVRVSVSSSGTRSLRSTEVGYMGHQAMLYGELTVRENLRLFATLSKLSTDAAEQGIERWELARHADKKPAELSKGLLARASLCRTFLSKPRFLFLDEPTSPLDQRSCALLLEELSALRRFHHEQMLTVIATHDLTRLQAAAGRVVILGSGNVLHDSAAASGGSGTSLVAAGVSVYLEHNR